MEYVAEGLGMLSGNWIKFAGRKYIVGAGEPVLDAMLRQGAPVRFSCRKGTCRTCMLQAESGDPGREAVERLPQEYREMGMFLPCCATRVTTVEARLPDLTHRTHTAMVAETVTPAPGIVILRLEPMTELDWQPGQVIGLMNPAGDLRRYSIVSTKADDFLEIHVRIYEGGAVSGWVAGLSAGDKVTFQAPMGDFTYRRQMLDRPLLLIGTGTGGGVLTGILRAALDAGHAGPIHLYLGGRTGDDLYLDDHVHPLPGDRVTVLQAASREAYGCIPAARVGTLAFDWHRDLGETEVFLCGTSDMIESARIRALQNGAALDRIHSESFDTPKPYVTTNAARLKAKRRDQGLWEALEHGAKLTDILIDFYTHVYADQQLAPCFHRVTKSRAIEKQYTFLQDLFSGTRLHLCEEPFNAPQWMVLTDELFDHLEKMFLDVVRRHGLAEPLIHRWAALHETFRRDLVKSATRGILRNGVEVDLDGFSQEIMEIGSVCDGCHAEIMAGEAVLMHNRTGEAFCQTCEGHQKVEAA
ncbi:FAD-binding oxidoreductase [Mesobacterium pallidum]|uniref:FAD-binding oxidoreductase n=1 Tax=Mesobacterium pallidum TaxID=2872037 RepID=UPI001EE31BF5